MSDKQVGMAIFVAFVWMAFIIAMVELCIKAQ